MDILTFIAEIVKTLSWPIASILIALIFKEPLSKIIKNVESLSYKGAVLKFGERVKQLEIEINKEIPAWKPTKEQVADKIQTHKTAATGKTPLERPETSSSEKYSRDEFDDIYCKLEESSFLAIDLAWTKLEIEAMFALKRHGYFEENGGISINPFNILNGLKEKKLLDNKQLHIVNELRKLRNNAINHIRYPMPESMALGYIAATQKVYKYLKTI